MRLRRPVRANGPATRHRCRIGQFDAALRLGAACTVGSAVGATLLLITPTGMFERIVPFLVGVASLLILGRRAADENVGAGVGPGAASAGVRSSGVTWSAFAGMFAVALYSGYFAAASGVVLLALLLATRASEGLLRSNALKNVLVGVADVIAAVAFALFGHVSWMSAVPLALGLLLGSWLRPAARPPARCGSASRWPGSVWRSSSVSVPSEPRRIPRGGARRRVPASGLRGDAAQAAVRGRRQGPGCW